MQYQFVGRWGWPQPKKQQRWKYNTYAQVNSIGLCQEQNITMANANNIPYPPQIFVAMQER
jgi:hypothetical protein